jgi:hypothetical protein
MVDLFEQSRATRQVAEERQAAMRPEDRDNPRAYAALHQPFHEQLLDACIRVKDDPKAAPKSLFVALPERLLGKIAHVTARGRPARLPSETMDVLGRYNEVAKDCRFHNLESKESLQDIRSVLICHGLSPIGDSVALLAEIGRAFRAAWSTGWDMRVMLADISWMSSNRSIRQFTSLTSEELDTGLRVCLEAAAEVCRVGCTVYRQYLTV